MVVPGADSGVLLKFRLWRESNIERLRKLLPKIANGRKARYQKRRKKTKPQPGGSAAPVM